MTSVLAKASELAIVEHDEYTIVLNLRHLNNPTPICLEGSALDIWHFIDGTRGINDIVEAVLVRYSVRETESAEAATAIISVVEDLIERGLATRRD